MTASSPPAIKMSVPFSAPDFDPVTGASTYLAPRAFTRSPNFLVAEGEIVLESTTTMPSLSDSSTPCGPNKTCSTALVSETHIHTTSAPLAASAGDAAMRAPSTSLPGERFQAATSWPAFSRFAAIGRPIIPRPKKATRVQSSPETSNSNMRATEAGVKQSAELSFRIGQRFLRSERLRVVRNPHFGLEIALNEWLTRTQTARFKHF